MGPSQLFGFPSDSLLLIGIAQALLGALDPFILVFALPEMIEVVERKHVNLTDKQKSRLTDETTGYLSSILACG